MEAVANNLSHGMRRYLTNYRTHDKQGLTEGEVIVGLGFLLGQHTKDPDKVTRWLAQIGLIGVDAARQEKENQ